MTLTPRDILSDCSSAFLRSLKDAWKAVGKTRLMTLKLSKQALIRATVELYILLED